LALGSAFGGFVMRVINVGIGHDNGSFYWVSAHKRAIRRAGERPRITP
jgi:hypothetical protein